MVQKMSTFFAASVALALLVPGARAQGPPGRPFPPGGPGGPGGLGLLMAPPVQKELAITDKQKSQLRRLETTLAQKRRQAFSRNRGEPFDPEQRRAAMERLQREQREAVAKVLDTKQNARLAEIELQREGVMALARGDIAKKVKLSKEQSSRIEAIVEEMREAERKAMPGPPGRFPRRPDGNAPGAGGGGEGVGEGDAFAPGPPGGFPGGDPPDEGGFPGGGPPPGEGEFPGGGPPPGGGVFPGDQGDGPAAPPQVNMEELRARFEKMRREREQIRAQATKQIEDLLTAEQKAAFKKLQGKPFDLASLRPGPGPEGPQRANRGATRSRGRTRSGASQAPGRGVTPEE